MKHKTLWFIAIIPDAEVVSQVRAVQQEIADRFGPRRILKIPVHITLEAPFRYDAVDIDMPALLENFFAARDSFSLELRNFGSFRQDVVFIEVAASLPLVEMQAQLAAFMRTETGIVRGEPWQGGYTPHLTVANRDVTPEIHKAIWREFNTRKFYAALSIAEICLLRHDEKTWQVHRRFQLRKSA